MFGAKPKVQWDVHSTYSNLTKRVSAANHYEYGEEMTPKYGILFGPTDCKYFRDFAKQMSNPYIVNPDLSLSSMCPPCSDALVEA